MLVKLSLRGWSKPMERGQVLLLALICLLTIASWALTIRQAQTMDMPMGIAVSGAGHGTDSPGTTVAMDAMPGMAMDASASDQLGEMAASGMSAMGWSWEAFVAFLFAWAVMMAAMMFPAAAPMLLFFHKVASQRAGQGRAFVPTWIFAAGYLLVWTGIGAATWVLIQLTSDLAGRLADASRETWAPLALGAVLVVAGLYQFTPLKGACLRQCQSPVGFVLTHWRAGRGGALQMGVVHGMYCLGCCWLLFAVLVAAGVMSLAWMLALTLVVFAEKSLPFGTRMVQLTGAAFIVLGVLVTAGAADLPWPA
jgi:predicted metal-binding membrane protein